MSENVLSFDFGASNGRAVLGKFDGKKIEIEEVHRFDNKPITINGTLHWDINMLFDEVKKTLQKVSKDKNISSIAVDTWGVDFGLLDENGALMNYPVHYRDERTNNMSEEVNRFIPLEKLYELTGNQIIFFNTIFQLAYMNKYERQILDQAKSLLLMPDLFNYLLTGEARAEATIASTTQLFDPYKKNWHQEVIDALNIPGDIFKEIVQPGEEVGRVSEELADELSIPRIPVVATTSHDTAGAVVSVPAPDYDFLFVSCGTWSLIGTELDEPIISPRSAAYNITNESGFNGTTRFLKNVTGLWILQETKREFEAQGKKYSYDEITRLAKDAEPFKTVIDVDYTTFKSPGNMPGKIKAYAQRTNQPFPETDGELFRTIYESLALKYRNVFKEIAECTGIEYEKVNIVGGGSQADILCQMVADASDVEVKAGPVEATVIGNSLVQMISKNMINSISEGRKIIQDSFDVKAFQSNYDEDWNKQYERYKDVLHLMEQLERNR